MHAAPEASCPHSRRWSEGGFKRPYFEDLEQTAGASSRQRKAKKKKKKKKTKKKKKKKKKKTPHPTPVTHLTPVARSAARREQA